MHWVLLQVNKFRYIPSDVRMMHLNAHSLMSKLNLLSSTVKSFRISISRQKSAAGWGISNTDSLSLLVPPRPPSPLHFHLLPSTFHFPAHLLIHHADLELELEIRLKYGTNRQTFLSAAPHIVLHGLDSRNPGLDLLQPS